MGVLQVVIWHPGGSLVLLRDGELPVLTLLQGNDLSGVLALECGVEVWPLHDDAQMMGREGVAQVEALSDLVPEGFIWGEAKVSPPSNAREWQRLGWPQQAREELPVRRTCPDLEARLCAAYLNALGCTAAGLLLNSLPLSLLHRAAVYDAQFRHGEGTVSRWRPLSPPVSGWPSRNSPGWAEG